MYKAFIIFNSGKELEIYIDEDQSKFLLKQSLYKRSAGVAAFNNEGKYTGRMVIHFTEVSLLKINTIRNAI